MLGGQQLLNVNNQLVAVIGPQSGLQDTEEGVELLWPRPSIKKLIDRRFDCNERICATSLVQFQGVVQVGNLDTDHGQDLLYAVRNMAEELVSLRAVARQYVQL